jgi:hypothetical protein
MVSWTPRIVVEHARRGPQAYPGRVRDVEQPRAPAHKKSNPYIERTRASPGAEIMTISICAIDGIT